MDGGEAPAPCSCCGRPFPPERLARLSCHAEIAICSGCADWLAGKTRPIGRAVPVLPTDDLAASIAFWTLAGFDVQRFGTGFALARLDGVELHLVARDGEVAGGAYLHARDVDALHAEWRAAGVEVSAVGDAPSGMREFSVVDPGGNRVRLGRGS